MPEPARLAALARRRASSQLMHRPRSAAHAGDVARTIAGAQAQEPRAGALQLRSRSRSLTAAAVERARVEERSLVRGWLMRGTVHLVAADDYGWMLSLFAEPILRDSRRRLAQLGLDAGAQERARELAGRALAGEGVLARSALVERLAGAGIDLPGEARIHLMRVLVAEGVACVGPDEGGGGTLAGAADWLRPAPRRVERDAALAELARRYLRAFAPAGERDFAKWSGLGLRDCRRGLERIAAELSRGADGLLSLAAAPPRAAARPLVRLLAAFDTYLMGYASRAHAAAPGAERRILPGGGVLRPTICVDGRLVGTWSASRRGRRLEVELEPFEELGEDTLAALAAEVEDLGRFEALEATLRAP